jgi:hypothetical protein
MLVEAEARLFGKTLGIRIESAEEGFDFLSDLVIFLTTFRATAPDVML